MVPLMALAAMLCGVPAFAQTGSAAAVACPRATEVSSVHLYGLWNASIEGLPGVATVLFERSREFPDGLSGAISRDGAKALVAGDVDEGVFTLEESADGRTIDGIWNGKVVEDSCGKEISGHWRRAGQDRLLPFVLRKRPGWQ